MGNLYAAALGAVAGKADQGLESLSDVTPEDNVLAGELVREGRVSVSVTGISSRILIRAEVTTAQDTAEVTIRNSHTNITKITVNGSTIFESGDECESTGGQDSGQAEHLIHRYTLADFLSYVQSVPAEEIAFVAEAYRVNMELFEEGLRSPRTTFSRALLEMNG